MTVIFLVIAALVLWAQIHKVQQENLIAQKKLDRELKKLSAQLKDMPYE